MKTLKLFIAILVLSVGVANAQFTKAELQVSGLTCSMCSKATEKSLRTLDFISDIKVDLNKNLFVITFKKDVPVNIDMISKKVQNAGFFVNNLKLNFNFNNVKLADNYFNYQGNTYKLMNANHPLSGDVAVTVVDKGFSPPNVYKKYQPAATDSGKPGKVYHLTI
ncbi:heavy-metal-associated domain-containing protein [Mucilaginibacter sp. E4BP6]|uniref:heavy-metal-associated domain-containing protein n=1 Tax=Mucilaginibacter sp. E4BP6 TaxID=2723089 RepID=UPI0015CC4B6F|nr:heavy metal-associated domain-containing protein [Mucilaginibacter sp. E4BP6]NYE68439.1 copper chaperone CopZ [Mucilaginibacter sp. E4BP6]